MAISIDKALGIFPKALTLRSQKASLIAKNLANVDTPHYKSRDIDFKQALKQMDQVQMQGLQKTNEKHISGSSQPLNMHLKYRIPVEPSLDGNTVDAHLESSAFAENQLRYEATLTFLNGRIRSMLSAIKGE